MLGGGLYRGSTVLISGSAGTGKTSLAAQLADGRLRARRTGAVLLVRGVARSVAAQHALDRPGPARLGRDAACCGSGRSAPPLTGSRSTWSNCTGCWTKFDPALVVLDAMGGLSDLGTPTRSAPPLARQIDLIKSRGITAVLTALTHDGQDESSAMAVSSLVDTWLLLRNTESDGERNRLLFVIKSRGSAHSNQVREFVLTDRGAELLDVYVGPQGMLTGSARVAQQAAGAGGGRRRRIDWSRAVRQALARRRGRWSSRSRAAQTSSPGTGGLRAGDRAGDSPRGGRSGRRPGVMAQTRWADPAAGAAGRPAGSRWMTTRSRMPPTASSTCGCTSPGRARSRSGRSRISGGCATSYLAGRYRVRGHRSAGEPETRPRRRDHRGADPGPDASASDSHHHR